jgi:hypothetical protein
LSEETRCTHGDCEKPARFCEDHRTWIRGRFKSIDQDHVDAGIDAKLDRILSNQGMRQPRERYRLWDLEEDLEYLWWSIIKGRMLRPLWSRWEWLRLKLGVKD